MKKTVYGILLFLLIAGAFLAGTMNNQRLVTRDSSHEERQVLYYLDPMNPAHTSDKPGVAPCGMPLEPVYSEDGPVMASIDGHRTPLSPGAIHVSPEKQQITGIRVSTVEKTFGIQTLRVFGQVAPDETRLYRLNAGAEGVIREISTVTTGSQVTKGQWLATFSAPEARYPIQAYMVTLETLDNQKAGMTETPAQARAAMESLQIADDRLLNLGISAIQIEEIRRTREVPATFRIYAPASGFVLARNATSGMKFEKGTEWYRIADLSKVWILANVFEHEAKYIKPGTHARISLPHQDQAFMAQVTDILPQFDIVARVLKVRLEVDNPGFVFRPDMFVDIEFLIPRPFAVTVPADAILDSGRRKTVFVSLGNGYFEPRPVKTGWYLNDRVEIVEGLMPGEQIVVSGNFLIDSESRMNLAAAGLFGMPEKDPVCGMEVYSGKVKKTGWTSVCADTTYYFCSGECKDRFDEEYGQFTENPEGENLPAIPAGNRGSAMNGFSRDIVCGMFVHEEKALKIEYEGVSLYFCSEQCMDKFSGAIEYYVKMIAKDSQQSNPLHHGDSIHD
ncbi:conserved hypothetical protein [Candidatus Brocadia pituitae]|nr:conserved hypothetical protein [Candidatus Brocadia pituitae]